MWGFLYLSFDSATLFIGVRGVIHKKWEFVGFSVFFLSKTCNIEAFAFFKEFVGFLNFFPKTCYIEKFAVFGEFVGFLKKYQIFSILRNYHFFGEFVRFYQNFHKNLKLWKTFMNL